MSKPHRENREVKANPRDAGSRRWHLGIVILVLALVPLLVAVFVNLPTAPAPDPALGTERARETSKTAARLLAHKQAIESRLLAAAGDRAMAKLANGIDGAPDRQRAARIMRELRGDDIGVIAGACIVRASDGQRVPLAVGAGRLAACADPILRDRAMTTIADTVTRSSAQEDGGQTLLLATPLRSVTGPNAGVLSAELDVTALFDRVRGLSGDTVTSMLVDMGSSEVVASLPASADPVGSAPAADLSEVEPHLAGIIERGNVADQRLAAMGLVPSVVPLWSNDDGSRIGLIQLWPEQYRPWPIELRLALLLMLAAAFIVVLLLLRSVRRMSHARAEYQELYEEAREDALNDSLTSLGSHRAFQEELSRQMATFEAGGAPFSLMLLDLDDLKVVNDRDGLAIGDEMLVSMAQSMRDLRRPDDLLFRTGGDEFAVIMPGTDTEEAIDAAKRILHFCKRPSTGARPSPFSCGISSVPRFTKQRDMLYGQAEAAMRWAKRHGRGTVEVFDPERDHLPDEFTDVVGNAVQEVVTGKLLHPVFQPIVDLRSGRVLGFEGLIRPDPNGPLTDTSRLFAAAAASGRTVELDLACLDTVVAAARDIGPDLLLTLNVSPRTLEVKDFDASWLLSSLIRNGISPSRVIIELTERDEIDDLDRLQQTFNLLQQYGLRLAADDVGAGNSGLRLLSQVQFDIVKIDLSLVQDGVSRMGSRAVLQSIRDLALSQRAHIVAEGVETAKQLQVIRELDIGAGQGFLLGRPDASLQTAVVDVRQLASGVVVPSSASSTEPPAPVVESEEADEAPDGGRVFPRTPARPVLDAGLGSA